LLKPVDERELLSAIRRATERPSPARPELAT
jgi:hypothetical protein